MQYNIIKKKANKLINLEENYDDKVKLDYHNNNSDNIMESDDDQYIVNPTQKMKG